MQTKLKEHLNRMWEIQIRGLLLTLSESNTILTESKPEVKKTLICSKSKEGTAESSWSTRSARLLLTSIKSLLQMREMDNYCKQTWETKLEIKKAILCGSLLKVFSKATAH